MPINSRTKGASGERELIRLIEDELGIRLKRNLAQSFAGGHDLLNPTDEDMQKKAGVYRVVSALEKLKDKKT